MANENQPIQRGQAQQQINAGKQSLAPIATTSSDAARRTSVPDSATGPSPSSPAAQRRRAQQAPDVATVPEAATIEYTQRVIIPQLMQAVLRDTRSTPDLRSEGTNPSHDQVVNRPASAVPNTSGLQASHNNQTSNRTAGAVSSTSGLNASHNTTSDRTASAVSSTIGLNASHNQTLNRTAGVNPSTSGLNASQSSTLNRTADANPSTSGLQANDTPPSYDNQAARPQQGTTSFRDVCDHTGMGTHQTMRSLRESVHRDPSVAEPSNTSPLQLGSGSVQSAPGPSGHHKVPGSGITFTSDTNMNPRPPMAKDVWEDGPLRNRPLTNPTPTKKSWIQRVFNMKKAKTLPVPFRPNADGQFPRDVIKQQKKAAKEAVKNAQTTHEEVLEDQREAGYLGEASGQKTKKHARIGGNAFTFRKGSSTGNWEICKPRNHSPQTRDVESPMSDDGQAEAGPSSQSDRNGSSTRYTRKDDKEDSTSGPGPSHVTRAVAPSSSTRPVSSDIGLAVSDDTPNLLSRETQMRGDTNPVEAEHPGYLDSYDRQFSQSPPITVNDEPLRLPEPPVEETWSRQMFKSLSAVGNEAAQSSAAAPTVATTEARGYNRRSRSETDLLRAINFSGPFLGRVSQHQSSNNNVTARGTGYDIGRGLLHLQGDLVHAQARANTRPREATMRMAGQAGPRMGTRPGHPSPGESYQSYNQHLLATTTQGSSTQRGSTGHRRTSVQHTSPTQQGSLGEYDHAEPFIGKGKGRATGGGAGQGGP